MVKAAHRSASDTRRENLRRLMKKRGANQLARDLGYANASFLSQMAGPKPIRGVTEKTARRFEAALGLSAGALDVPLERDEPAAANGKSFAAEPSQAASIDLTADVIRLVGRLFDEEGVDVSSAVRFADVVALAVMDAVEHVRSLVRLVKPQ